MLETRRLLAGVTVITHGFNSSVDDWITAMADAIGTRSSGTIDQPRYRVEVTDPGHDGGPLSVINTSRSGPVLEDWTGATDIVILLNWSDVAGSLSLGGGYHRSTVDVAAAIAEKLLSPNFLTGLTSPVAELPFHLIGHSRGASLVGELAKKMGEKGVWVDQVTTLDPHPVDGVREPWLFNYNFGDAPMTSWINVTFWDNYWRTDGSSSLDFTGESVANVYNVQLSEAVLTNGGYSTEHSDVHLWYHGTIDTLPTATDGTYTVPISWYGGANPPRDATGFSYSRIVDGPRPMTGLSSELGGTATRTDINWTTAQWPNILGLNVSGGNLQFVSGDLIPVSYYYQDYDSAAAISFSLDIDQNPYSQNTVGMWNENVAKTGEAPMQSGASLDTIGIPNGTYYVTAKITDSSGRTRYDYSLAPVTIILPVHTTHTWNGKGTDNNWSTAANWVGNIKPSPGDNLVFPAGAERMDNINDYPSNTFFGSIVVSGGNYHIQNNAITSSTVEVQGNASLTTASIVCDTFTIGSLSGAADSVIPTNTAVLYTSDMQQAVGSDFQQSTVDEKSVISSAANDSTGVVERSATEKMISEIALATPMTSVPPISETPQTAHAALPIDNRMSTTPEIVLFRRLPEHREQQNNEPLVAPRLLQGSFAWSFKTDLNMAKRPDSHLTSNPILMAYRLIDSVFEKMTNTLERMKKQSSTIKDQKAHDLVLDSIVSEIQHNIAIEREDSTLLMRRR